MDQYVLFLLLGMGAGAVYAALGIADRGYVMENGRISAAGEAQRLLSDAAVQEAYLGGAGGGARAMEQRIRDKRRAILGR